MKKRNDSDLTWVLWWLLAIMISVLCLAFTGVKRAYGQQRQVVKDKSGKVVYTVRSRSDGSREVKDATGRLEAIVREDDSGRTRVQGSDGRLEAIIEKADTANVNQSTTF